jgi:hypothetical protein
LLFCWELSSRIFGQLNYPANRYYPDINPSFGLEAWVREIPNFQEIILWRLSLSSFAELDDIRRAG